MRVVVENREDTATVYGEATPFRIATLAAEAAGKVAWRSPALEVGGVVAEGEALLLLDDGLAKLGRDAAQAGLEAREADRKRQEVALQTATEQEELARREVQRLERLVGAGDASETLLDQVRTSFLTARSAREGVEYSLRAARASQAEASIVLERADEEIARHKIVAPFEGEISNPSVEIGEWLAPGSPICHLVDREHLKIRVQVPTGVVNGLDDAARVHLRFPGVEGPKGPIQIPGTIIGVDPVARSDSRSREVVVLVSNPKGLLPLGAFAEVELNKGPESAIWLRSSWFVFGEKSPIAYVVSEGERVEARLLSLGPPVFDGESKAWHPVRAGLSSGDLLVVDNIEVLKDGSSVTVLHRPPPSRIPAPLDPTGQG
tara:strand:+ start:1582 stop:2709 length:1128 start_codon:yes stop_codon:yes gene_type:complete